MPLQEAKGPVKARRNSTAFLLEGRRVLSVTSTPWKYGTTQLDRNVVTARRTSRAHLAYFESQRAAMVVPTACGVAELMPHDDAAAINYSSRECVAAKGHDRRIQQTRMTREQANSGCTERKMVEVLM